MKRPLNAYGITAYSWINALGARVHRSCDEPTSPSTWRLDESGLVPAQGLPFQTYWGPSRQPLPAMPERIAHHRSRCSQLFWAALSELESDVRAALQRWGPARVGLVVGSSTGGIDVTEQVVASEHQGSTIPVDYDFDSVHPFSALVHMARAAFGFEGPGYVVSTACSSGGKAMAASQRLIEAGICDAVITGGTDALCQMTLRGFASLGILSTSPCRPFDAARNGISIGEGSAVMLLERSGPCAVYLLGAGESSDAHHTTAPHPEGLGARLALEEVLEHAGLEPGRVDYINAHGTGTQQNDSAEARALHDVFGAGAVFSSTKDRVGHQLGSAGATEAAFCLDALLTDKIPGNRPVTTRDPELAVQPVLATRRHSSSVTLSNSFAFGGSNVVVALGKSPGDRRDRTVAGRAWVESIAFWSPGYPHLPALLSGLHDPNQQRPDATLLPARPRGRASLLTRLFAELLDQLGEHHRDELATLPMVFGSALGEMTTTLRLLDQIAENETPSPAAFQSSVHNTAAGAISIALGNRVFSTALAAGSETLAMSLLEAMAWLSVHGGRIAVLVADEEAPSRLTRAGSYPAAGLGFLLSWSDDCPLGALGSIRRLERRTTSDSSVDDGFEGIGGRLPGLERAPAGRGVPLARALLQKQPGRYAVGDEWVIEIDSPR